MRLFLKGIVLCLPFALGLWLSASQAPPSPAPDYGQIGSVVGRILSIQHYRRQPIDDSISRKFLQLYLDTLDYNHLFFLQSDISEFQKYATVLDEETLSGDVKPGFEIFARYVQRVEERVALVKKLLKEPFSFDGNDRILLDRSDAPWPANEEEAVQLWRQHIKFELLQERLNKKKTPEAQETISRRYDRMLRNVHEEDGESVLEFYLSSLARAYDPHSAYMSAAELHNFAISMKLSLVGIGALLGSNDGYAKVSGIVPGGPADLDKRLKPNDRIVGVAQRNGPMVDVVDMKLSKAVELIRGEKGTEVRLLVIPAEAADPATRVEIKLKRDEIKLAESEAKAKLIECVDSHSHPQRLGYLELPSFYADMESDSEYAADAPADMNVRSATRDVINLIEKLKARKVNGLILDLRRNGGGSLAEAVRLTGLFIKSGPVVQIKDSRGRIDILKDNDPSVATDMPLVVLVGHMSASASEIFAAALQDYGRAVIVGEQTTFGKGTVQKLQELNNFISDGDAAEISAGALKWTVQKFYRISGGSTQYRGVTPDIQLPSQLDYLKINESSLKNALPYDEVPEVSYMRMNRVAGILPELQRRSQERVMRDAEFAYIREDIAELKIQLENKTLSLNENQRLKERMEAASSIEKRKNERAARKIPTPVIIPVQLQSQEEASSKIAMLTQKVIDQANATMNEPDDNAVPKDFAVDPEFHEGLEVLSDMIELFAK